MGRGGTTFTSCQDRQLVETAVLGGRCDGLSGTKYFSARLTPSAIVDEQLGCVVRLCTTVCGIDRDV